MLQTIERRFNLLADELDRGAAEQLAGNPALKHVRAAQLEWERLLPASIVRQLHISPATVARSAWSSRCAGAAAAAAAAAASEAERCVAACVASASAAVHARAACIAASRTVASMEAQVRQLAERAAVAVALAAAAFAEEHFGGAAAAAAGASALQVRADAERLAATAAEAARARLALLTAADAAVASAEAAAREASSRHAAAATAAFVAVQITARALAAALDYAAALQTPPPMEALRAESALLLSKQAEEEESMSLRTNVSASAGTRRKEEKLALAEQLCARGLITAKDVERVRHRLALPIVAAAEVAAAPTAVACAAAAPSPSLPPASLAPASTPPPLRVSPVCEPAESSEPPCFDPSASIQALGLLPRVESALWSLEQRAIAPPRRVGADDPAWASVTESQVSAFSAVNLTAITNVTASVDSLRLSESDADESSTGGPFGGALARDDEEETQRILQRVRQFGNAREKSTLSIAEQLQWARAALRSLA